MERKLKMAVILLAVAFFVSAALVGAFASGNDKGFKKATQDAGRTLVNYPANVVNESAKVAVKAAEGVGVTAAGTAKAAGDTFLGGEGKRAPDIVKTPIKGTAETTRDAAEGTVRVPVEAGKVTAEQNR